MKQTNKQKKTIFSVIFFLLLSLSLVMKNIYIKFESYEVKFNSFKWIKPPPI